MLEYLQVKAVVMVISVTSAAINFGLASVWIILLVNEYSEVKLSAIFKGTLCVAIIYVIPQFIIEFLFYYPDIIDQRLESFFLFPNPLYMFPYFWILTRIVKLPQRFSVSILSEILYSQYIILLLFRGYSGLLVSSTILTAGWTFSVEADILAMFATFLTSCLFTLAALVYLRGKPRRQKVTDQPVEPHGLKKNIRISLGTISMYLLISLLGIHNLSVRGDSWEVQDILICVTLIFVLITNIKDGARKRRLDILEWNDFVTNEYIRSLTLICGDLHSIQHSWNNILQVYTGYISLSDLDGLRKYHHSVVSTIESTNQSFTLISSPSHHRAMYAILHLKIQRARQEGLHLEIGRLDALSDVVINDMDMCRLLGNLLDNAIEAAQETEEKYVGIRCESKQANSVKLEISNSAKGSIDLQEIFKQGWTSKNGHSGMGLCVVRRILSAHDLCYILLEFSDSLFRVHLTLQTQNPWD